MPLLCRPPNCQQVVAKFVAPLGFGTASLRTQVRVGCGVQFTASTESCNSASKGGWGEGTPLLVTFDQVNTSTLFKQSGDHV